MADEWRTKSAAICLRALPEERRALEHIARLERRNPSELIREWIRAEAQRRDLWPTYGGRPPAAGQGGKDQ